MTRTAAPAPPGSPVRHAPAWQVWGGQGVVYVVWGSTYLGIRVMIETMPPLLAAAIRYGSAGVILAVVLALRGGVGRFRVSRRELASAVLIGAILLGVGNSGVTLGERWVPSGLTALIIGMVPLIVLLLRRIAGERVSRVGMAGIVVGLVGLAVLVAPLGMGGEVEPIGIAILLVAATGWAIGSFLSRRVPLPHDPFVSTVFQMFAGTVFALACSALLGEPALADPAGWSTRSLVSLVYLTLVGTLLTYSIYTWLLQHAPVSQVATYAYVNPVIAVTLGWLVLGEDITPGMLAGALLILASVAVTLRAEGRQPRQEDAEGY
jgi:drug/metabolite transporter (DMT)-like permease